jgi:hypothetical protein
MNIIRGGKTSLHVFGYCLAFLVIETERGEQKHHCILKNGHGGDHLCQHGLEWDKSMLHLKGVRSYEPT